MADSYQGRVSGSAEVGSELLDHPACQGVGWWHDASLRDTTTIMVRTQPLLMGSIDEHTSARL